jgi:hypothetical protein
MSATGLDALELLAHQRIGSPQFRRPSKHWSARNRLTRLSRAEFRTVSLLSRVNPWERRCRTRARWAHSRNVEIPEITGEDGLHILEMCLRLSSNPTVTATVEALRTLGNTGIAGLLSLSSSAREKNLRKTVQRPDLWVRVGCSIGGGTSW